MKGERCLTKVDGVVEPADPWPNQHRAQSWSSPRQRKRPCERSLPLSRLIVYKHVNRALAAGVKVASRHLPHGSAPTITAKARAWTLTALAKHIRRTAATVGHPSLTQVVKSTVHLTLRNAPLRPHKIKYSRERRDPESERKMKADLIVYREIDELAQHPPPPGTPREVTVSADEKPDVQALATTSADLAPVPRRAPRSEPRL